MPVSLTRQELMVLGEIYYDVLSKKVDKLLEINPHEYVTKKVQILAKTDSGKTYLASKICELLLKAGIPICILDPVGHYWALKQGFKIVIFGSPNRKFADYHIFDDNKTIEAQAEVIADYLATNRASAIIDFKGWKDYQKQKFVATFADRLYRVGKIERHIFIEEADIFCPQKIDFPSPDLISCRHNIDNLVRRGRSEGFGTTVISQRPAIVDKNILTQSDLAFYKHLGSRSDLKPARDEIEDDENFTKEQKKDIIARIKKLPREDSFVYSPRWLGLSQFIHVAKKQTYHAGATRGEKDYQNVETMKFVKVEIEDVVNTIKKITEEKGQEATAVKEKQKTEQELRAEVADLNRKLAQSTKPTASAPVTKEQIAVYSNQAREAKLVGYQEGQKKGAELAGKEYGRKIDEANSLITKQQRLINSIREQVGAEQTPATLIEKPKIQLPVITIPNNNKALPPPKDTLRVSYSDVPMPATAKFSIEDNSIPKVSREILKFMAMRPGKSFNKQQLGVMSGYKQGGNFFNGLGLLKNRGFITQNGADSYSVNDEKMPEIMELLGQDYQHDSKAAMEGWISRLGKAPKVVYEYLLRNPDGVFTKEELAAATGYNLGGNFFNALGSLCIIGLAQKQGNNQYQLNPEVKEL